MSGASGRATHEQNPQAVSAVPVGIPDAFDSFAAYQREREENARLYALLLRAKVVLEANADRLERRGLEVSHIRNFARELAA